MSTLYIFAGLPGSGKTTLARHLAKQINALHLRIDTIEQGLRDLCGMRVEGEGYRLAYRIASDNLALGLDVVADSCNPIELTRREWEQVAHDAGANYRNIEVVCSDATEHRRRVEARTSDIPSLSLPSWQAVVRRDYHDWTVERTIMDTAGLTETESAENLLGILSM